MKMVDTVILTACGVLAVLLIVVLVWWLKSGKRHFIEKRCPERLSQEEPKQEKGSNSE